MQTTLASLVCGGKESICVYCLEAEFIRATYRFRKCPKPKYLLCHHAEKQLKPKYSSLKTRSGHALTSQLSEILGLIAPTVPVRWSTDSSAVARFKGNTKFWKLGRKTHSRGSSACFPSLGFESTDDDFCACAVKPRATLRQLRNDVTGDVARKNKAIK